MHVDGKVLVPHAWARLGVPTALVLPAMTSVFRQELRVGRTMHGVDDVRALPDVDGDLEHEHELRQDMEERCGRDMKGPRQTRAGCSGPDRLFWLIGRDARTVLNFVQWLRFTAYLPDLCSLCRKTSRWKGQQA